nr:PHP domain-containing protein [Castellaniella sp.]
MIAPKPRAGGPVCSCGSTSELLRASSCACASRVLHIHSFGDGGSYDVTDATMTPEGIVDTAIAEGLDLIAITDHNRITNVRRALKYAEGRNLLVVPGVELSTPQGHLLVYFEMADQLQRFFGKLNISDDQKACHNTIPQCLRAAAEFSGFGICAHIEMDSGLEKAAPKFDAFKQEVFNCPNLLGLEIAHASNSTLFSHDDADANRRNCAVARCAALGLEEGVELAKVMSSDAHTLNALGRNASGNRRLTRLKMEALTFASLRIALMDATARVRLEDLIPESVRRTSSARSLKAVRRHSSVGKRCTDTDLSPSLCAHP